MLLVRINLHKWPDYITMTWITIIHLFTFAIVAMHDMMIAEFWEHNDVMHANEGSVVLSGFISNDTP